MQNMTRSEMEILIKARAAIVITTFAAMLAINSMVSGSNSSAVLQGTIASGNLWAWYQAKNVRSAIFEESGNTAEAERMRQDMSDIMEKARAVEAKRDHAKTRSPYFTYAGSALQIGIVLSTSAILAVAMPLLWASVGVGAIGTGLLAYGYLGV